MTQTIRMHVGLPASGKTTKAKELEKEGWVRICKDDIRANMERYTRKKEKEVIRTRNFLIRQALQDGKNVVVDDTNLNPIHERSIRAIAREFNIGFEKDTSFLEVPIKTCIERDLKRPNSVGQNVIYSMYYRWIKPYKPAELERYPLWKLRRAILVDIDGTLAINTSGRSFYDMKRVGEDTPDPFVGFLLDAISTADMHEYLDVIIMSGRSENARKDTESWLRRNMFDYKHLFMRAEGDTRPDDIVKKELYQKHIEDNWVALGVIDDRPKVCNMWRELGLRVAQVGNPYDDF